jgi:hypothetical protein
VANSKVPKSITIGERTYEILSLLIKKELDIAGFDMISRAEDLNANLGEEEGRYILEHQKDIPADLEGKIIFILPNWRIRTLPSYFYWIEWDKDSKKWEQSSHRLDNYSYGGICRLLRRIGVCPHCGAQLKAKDV